MALAIGTWSINANGYKGELDITAVDAQGNLTGTVFVDGLFGLWDENSRKITFTRMPNPADPSTFQIYTGYQYQNVFIDNPASPLGLDSPDLRTRYTLAGCFESFQASGGTADRSVYGWYAEIVRRGAQLEQDRESE